MELVGRNYQSSNVLIAQNWQKMDANGFTNRRLTTFFQQLINS
jgi:hypothetical protein